MMVISNKNVINDKENGIDSFGDNR